MKLPFATEIFTGTNVGKQEIARYFGILSLSAVIDNEFLRGGIAIAGVAVYYFFIWLFRDKLSNEFVFYIE